VIIARAKDQNADPRAIEDCFPSKMVMRLIDLDTEAGTFLAETVTTWEGQHG